VTYHIRCHVQIGYNLFIKSWRAAVKALSARYRELQLYWGLLWGVDEKVVCKTRTLYGLPLCDFFIESSAADCAALIIIEISGFLKGTKSSIYTSLSFHSQNAYSF